LGNIIALPQEVVAVDLCWKEKEKKKKKLSKDEQNSDRIQKRRKKKTHGEEEMSLARGRKKRSIIRKVEIIWYSWIEECIRFLILIICSEGRIEIDI